METVSRENPIKIPREYWGLRCDPEAKKILGSWANEMNSRFERTGPRRLNERWLLELIVRHIEAEIAGKRLRLEDLLTYEQDDD